MTYDSLYFYNKKYSFEKNQAINAAKNGRLQDLIIAYETNCCWSPEVCSYAAGKGHLTCLIFARENNCPWDERTPSYASKHGQLQCLKYAIENDCPIDENSVYFACSKNNVDCVKYLLERKAPICETSYFACAKYNSIECLNLLIQNNVTFDTRAYIYAIENANLEILRILINNFEWEHIDIQYNPESLECLKFLYVSGKSLRVNNKVIMKHLNYYLLKVYIIKHKYFFKLYEKYIMKACDIGGKLRENDMINLSLLSNLLTN